MTTSMATAKYIEKYTVNAV